MTSSQIFRQSRRYFLRCAATIAAIFLIATTNQAQTTPAIKLPDSPWSQDLKKYPGLADELGRLIKKLKEVQTPSPRSESHLLPMLPESTMFYSSLSNYGGFTHQLLAIFHQELQESAVLRDWWTHGSPKEDGPKLVEVLEKFDQLNQFLGDEIVISGEFETHDPHALIVTELRKPGLDKFLQQWLDQSKATTKPGVRIFTTQDLAVAKDTSSTDKFFILVRSDFMIASFDLPTLRSFNTKLKTPSKDFAATPFGHRVTQAYGGGVTMLAAADIHKLLNQPSLSSKEAQLALQRSGFSDLNYFVWKHAMEGSTSVSQSELNFNGPRHGIAAWLAKPASLGSLDFVSPKALIATTVVLSDFPKIFDDIKEISGPSSANAFAAIAAGEKALGLSLKDDLLGQLSGELTVEMDDSVQAHPVWKAILKVNDAAHLQKTLNTLLVAGQLKTEQAETAGITYQSVRIPSQGTSIDLSYAFIDGYLVMASSPEAFAESVQAHRNGGSLAKSQKFLAALPPGQSLKASALFYQNPLAMAVPKLRELSPELAENLAKLPIEISPSVVRVYGDESSIRSTSSGSGFDVFTTLAVAAVAIPNLMRSRTAANEASAVGSIRSINTAQITYQVTYSQKGFAPNLATLGPDPKAPTKDSPDHAGLLDASLAGPTCTANAWCAKSGYQFRVRSLSCKAGLGCSEFLVVATPVDTNSGTRTFCSTSDGIIHFKLGPPLTGPLMLAQCRAWPPLQ